LLAYIVELAALDDGDRPVTAALIRYGEEDVLPAEGRRSDRSTAFSRIPSRHSKETGWFRLNGERPDDHLCHPAPGTDL